MGNKSSSSKQSGGAGGGAGAGMTKKKKRGKAMKLSSKQVQQKLDTAAKLGSLSLANAGLSKLPPALWELHKLRVLDVSFNKLPALPSDLCSLARLVKLQLGNNKLTALPDLDKLTKLTTLKLEGNQLTALPKLPTAKLRELVAGGNPLTVLPPELLDGSLVELTLLDLSGSDLAALITVELELNLPNLRDLVLDGTGIAQLPQSFTGVPKLQTIMLRYNHLTPKAISKSLLLDTALHRMQLEGNGSSFTQKRLQRLEGFEEFEARRVKRLNREIAGGLVVDRSLCGISD